MVPGAAQEGFPAEALGMDNLEDNNAWLGEVEVPVSFEEGCLIS